MLGGGIESRTLVEVHGEYRTGKTQLCLTMAVTAQICSNPGKVFYIDTEGTFSPDRIRQISERFDLDGERVLDNILHARVSFEILRMCVQIAQVGWIDRPHYSFEYIMRSKIANNAMAKLKLTIIWKHVSSS
jgi:RecA/RadA recombinase